MLSLMVLQVQSAAVMGRVAGIVPACRKSGIAAIWHDPTSGAPQMVLSTGKGQVPSIAKQSAVKATAYNDVWVLKQFSDNSFSWQLLGEPISPSTYPAPRWKSSGDVIGDSMVIYAGQKAYSKIKHGQSVVDDSKNFADVWEFSLKNRSWRQIEPNHVERGSPIATEANSANGYGGKLWSVAGRTAHGTASADLWSVDIPPAGQAALDAASLWTNYTPTVPADMHPRRGQGSTVVKHPITKRDLLMVFGGRFGETGYLNDLWAFDLESHTWQKMSPQSPTIPRARDHIVITSLQDTDGSGTSSSVLLFGGRCSGDPILTMNDVWQYDLRTDRWELLFASGNTMGPAPVERFLYSMASWQHSNGQSGGAQGFMMFGGEVVPGSATRECSVDTALCGRDGGGGICSGQSSPNVVGDNSANSAQAPAPVTLPGQQGHVAGLTGFRHELLNDLWFFSVPDRTWHLVQGSDCVAGHLGEVRQSRTVLSTTTLLVGSFSGLFILGLATLAIKSRKVYLSAKATAPIRKPLNSQQAQNNGGGYAAI